MKDQWYWTKKLSDTQKKYPTADQELLPIVECLKQYKTILFGQQITVWIDRKYLTFKNTEHVSDRVTRQHLLLEEYGADLQFIQGNINEAADMLSRNEFIHKLNITVDTSKFETMMYDMYNNEVDVPIDCLTIHKHQKDNI